MFLLNCAWELCDSLVKGAWDVGGGNELVCERQREFDMDEMDMDEDVA